MATRGKDEMQGFLSRWSQRKRAVEEDADLATGTAPEAPGDAAPGQGRPGAEAPDTAAEIDPADLPDIDSLEAGSDFSVFMRKGVPDALQRQALRKLWRLNPVFGHLDGLNDYDLDYTNAATVVENLKTLYQAGKGMVLPEEEEADKAKAAAEGVTPEGRPQPDASVKDEIGAAEQVTAETEAPANSAETAKTRDRNPGDPLVSGVTIRRSPAPRSAARSAQRRRWGDADS